MSVAVTDANNHRIPMSLEAWLCLLEMLLNERLSGRTARKLARIWGIRTLADLLLYTESELRRPNPALRGWRLFDAEWDEVSGLLKSNDLELPDQSQLDELEATGYWRHFQSDSHHRIRVVTEAIGAMRIEQLWLNFWLRHKGALEKMGIRTLDQLVQAKPTLADLYVQHVLRPGLDPSRANLSVVAILSKVADLERRSGLNPDGTWAA